MEKKTRKWRAIRPFEIDNSVKLELSVFFDNKTRLWNAPFFQLTFSMQIFNLSVMTKVFIDVGRVIYMDTEVVICMI